MRLGILDEKEGIFTITQLALGGVNLLSSQILLQSFNNGSFPATTYARSKRGGYQGTKMPTPSFASYQFVLTVMIVGTSYTNLVQLRDSFFQTLGTIHSSGVQTLIITRSDNTFRQIDIKAIEVTGDISTDDGVSSTVQVTLLGEYPFLQNAVPTSKDVQINNGGGFAIPFGIPFSMAAGQTTIVSVTNNGNYAAFPTFTFIGKLTNPSLTNNTTGQTLSLSLSLADNTQSAVVDCYNRTVLLEPSGNIARQNASGTFWTIPIGTSFITLGNANNTDGGKCTIFFRDTWLNS